MSLSHAIKVAAIRDAASREPLIGSDCEGSLPVLMPSSSRA
jgi:hypothetical protein